MDEGLTLECYTLRKNSGINFEDDANVLSIQ
jgi:hypothetical protein